MMPDARAADSKSLKSFSSGLAAYIVKEILIKRFEVSLSSWL